MFIQQGGLFLSLKLGINLPTVLVQMPSGTEKTNTLKQEKKPILKANNFNLTFESLCIATYSAVNINLSPFYFNNKHQVPSMDRSADLLVSPQGYLILLTSFVCISCWFNRHCRDDMLINDPGHRPVPHLPPQPHQHFTYTDSHPIPNSDRGWRFCFPEGPYSVYCCLHWRGQIQFILMTIKLWYTRIKRARR